MIVTRVMCAEMLGNSDVRATYTQRSYRKYTGLSQKWVRNPGELGTSYSYFQSQSWRGRLTDFNICNVKQAISLVKVRVLENLSRIVMQDVSNGVH